VPVCPFSEPYSARLHFRFTDRAAGTLKHSHPSGVDP
jgi:hypothetical protein